MTDETEKFLSVLDTSATAEHPLRKHDIFVDGVIEQVTFEYGKPTVLPYTKGAKFLLPGFIVKDANENEISIPSAESAGLAEDEVIAKLGELHDDALRLRAISRVGGESFAVGEVSRAALIAFLKTPPTVEDVEAMEAEVSVLENDEDNLDAESEDGIQADVQDNLPAPSGIVPENAEDEIEVDVGGETIEQPAEEVAPAEPVADVPAADDTELAAALADNEGLSDEAKAAHAEQAEKEAAEEAAAPAEAQEIVASDDAEKKAE